MPPQKLPAGRREKRHYRIMAPSKRKAERGPRRKRIIESRYSHRQHRKQAEIPRRAQIHPRFNIQKMVYRWLNGDQRNQERRETGVARGGRFRGKIRKYGNAREPSYDSSPLRDSSSRSIDEESEYTKSVGTSVDDLSRLMDAANSSAASSSENSTVSNISVEPIVLAKSINSTRALLKKKSLVQVINNYIKAGIEEGKRQAKKYLRKALSFGVKSGYLKPTDPRGQVIRVCPTLIESKRSDVDARRRRRKARKGEDNPFGNDKEHRRSTPPWNPTQKPYREPTPIPGTPPKKRRKISDTKTAYDKRKKSPGKKTMDRGRQGDSKGRRPRKNKRTVHPLNISPDGSDEDATKPRPKQKTKTKAKQIVEGQGIVERSENPGTRRVKSPRATREEQENSRKNRRSSSDGDSSKFSENEGEERRPVKRRKSTTSREDVPRNNDAPSELPVGEVEEKLDVPKNDEDNQDDAIQNMD